ncbi:MAG: reeler domain-containing protein [Pseudomonadota bacterium]
MRFAPLSIMLLAASLVCGDASANARGSPVCEVDRLPLAPMSPVLASPPPTGWRLELDEPRYFPGELLTVRVVNADPERLVRGVLLWAKLGGSTGAGSFVLPDGERYQYIPAPAQCETWAISHTDATPRTQDELVFEWQPPERGSVIIRAFLIEECGAPPGGCRSSQALTPILSISGGLFRSGFEP